MLLRSFDHALELDVSLDDVAPGHRRCLGPVKANDFTGRLKVLKASRTRIHRKGFDKITSNAQDRSDPALPETTQVASHSKSDRNSCQRISRDLK
jgi:hypothetical protein